MELEFQLAKPFFDEDDKTSQLDTGTDAQPTIIKRIASGALFQANNITSAKGCMMIIHNPQISNDTHNIHVQTIANHISLDD
jgi:hypothetical protein